MTVYKQVALLEAKGFVSFIFYLSNLEHDRLKRKPTEKTLYGKRKRFTDISYIKVPPTCSLLHSRIIPKSWRAAHDS